jgi:transposase InsO family protein
LILKLIEAIKRYGKPRIVRTDNEAVFTSKVFRFALLGIRHQRTDPGCPWQNGRALLRHLEAKTRSVRGRFVRRS